MPMLKMTTIVEWLNVEKNILMLTRNEPWTWNQFRECGQQAADLLESVDHPVYLIDNLQGNSFMPPTGFVENLKWVVANVHCHRNIQAVITVASRAIQPLFIPAIKQYGAPNREYLFVETLDQALNLIRERNT